MRKIAGFVFMGCPHSSSRDPKDWAGVESIVQKFTKGRKNSLEPQCVESLAVDCDSFRIILAEDWKPVLTVSEKKGMSKQVIGKKVLVSLLAAATSSFWARLICAQFVDRDSATIGHDLETLIEDNSNHRDLCMMSGGGRTHDKIFEFLHSVLDNTRKAIAKDSPRCKYITLC